jgi:hypothetical protein
LLSAAVSPVLLALAPVDSLVGTLDQGIDQYLHGRDRSPVAELCQ